MTMDFKGNCTWEGKKVEGEAREVGRGQTVEVNIYAKLKSLNFIPQTVRNLLRIFTSGLL